MSLLTRVANYPMVPLSIEDQIIKKYLMDLRASLVEESALRIGDRISDLDGTLTIRQNDDTIEISHDGDDAYIKWSDGALRLETDEGDNTNTVVEIHGNGTGFGAIKIYDEDGAEYLQIWATAGQAKIRIGGTTPSNIRIGEETNYVSIAPDGEINLVGTARVVRDMWVDSSGVRGPTTKPATWKEWGISGVWEFSDGTDDTIVASLKFPNDMDLTVAPSMSVGWSTNTAVVTETARWQLEYLYTAPGEDTTAVAQATIFIDSDAVAQADGLIVATFPAMAVPGATDVCVHCRVKRLGAVDDLTDTAELHGMCMGYTSAKLGTAT